MSVHALLLCALLFETVAPIPDPIAETYRTAYDCPQGAVHPQQPARAPLADVHRYFPAPARHWPVLRADDPALVGHTAALRAQGVRPAVLLPGMHEQLAADSALLERLRDAVRDGAVPVATLPDMDRRRQRATLQFWCSLRICPLAFHLPAGATTALAELMPGLYLAAPHWHGHEHLPLPARSMNIAGRTVLPLFDDAPPAGGTAAARIGPLHEGLATPGLPGVEWHWLGLRLRHTAAGPELGLAGHAVLRIHGAAVRAWGLLTAARIDIVAPASRAFAWLSIAFLLFNLLIIFSLALRRWTPRRASP